ncbi:biotin--[acetyl-CoA-carboxylase] ligase [Coxiella endosymbiont of Amblyomma nuttalli]|uniref:biotin--[acetyl-CoA-carboxylase] ligase n=1 Tax=Coxiella endosymbiont of Amblyomma nuttalli TaxID=2749996 RepID=UPI001BA77FA8|nr:biotin--[acetyl-CoA-carboxylase] ligase [Coxiella endosymbiont of Amblyomma nuttalli]QTS83923.1 Bifunctional ligase/repressor BirA [Coxiella endosymbiont of Amblyomma nuttalli]
MKDHKKNENFQISVRSIKLYQPLFLLSKQKIKSSVEKKFLHIDLFEQISSTNEYLKTIKHSNKLHICTAEMQTHGKGRFKRKWYSPFGQNIYLSLKYLFNKDISALTGLSLVCGMAVCNAIETVCHIPKDILMKWPNDIICDDKKLSGILIEIIETETHGSCSVIIGIGLNVNMDTDNDNWTSIKKLTGFYQDRNQLCSALINRLVDNLSRFEKEEFNPFLTLWKKRDYLFKKQMRLRSGQREFYGEGVGINEKGHLLLQLSDGSQKVFSSGDTTLLK